MSGRSQCIMVLHTILPSLYVHETKPPFNHHKTNNSIFVSAVIIVQRIIRVVVSDSFDNVESVDWDQGPGVTTMVLSIWHYYVISDQSHTMVSVSELRRWWLMTMALGVAVVMQPTLREVRSSHQVQPGFRYITNTALSIQDSLHTLNLIPKFISNIISFLLETQFSHILERFYSRPISKKIFFLGNWVDLQMRCKIDSVTLLARLEDLEKVCFPSSQGSIRRCGWRRSDRPTLPSLQTSDISDN